MPWGGPDLRDQTVASDTSTRVGDILERAEARAREIREQADRSAAETRRTARHEAEGIAKEARRAAVAAARERVHQITELRASIAARAGSLVEGLEGGELTAARLQELVRALGQAADRVMQEVADDAPPRPDGAIGEAGSGEGARGDAAPGDAAAAAAAFAGSAPDGASGQAARAVPARSAADAPPPGLFTRTEPTAAAEPESDEPVEHAIPDGAPLVRRPQRSSARFTAVVMAIQGMDREAVAARLAAEHGLDDASELLDDVFGRADAPA
jgi:vacuolar-type H+-ATPase subunit H